MLVEQIWTDNPLRNFHYLVACAETREALAIDPFDHQLVLKRAEALGWKITQILNTHEHFDHIDGNPDNNTKDNIRMLCPNCHSQTDTFGVKNKKSKNTQRNIYRRKNYRDKTSNVNLSKDA